MGSQSTGIGDVGSMRSAHHSYIIPIVSSCIEPVWWSVWSGPPSSPVSAVTSRICLQTARTKAAAWSSPSPTSRLNQADAM